MRILKDIPLPKIRRRKAIFLVALFMMVLFSSGNIGKVEAATAPVFSGNPVSHAVTHVHETFGDSGQACVQDQSFYTYRTRTGTCYQLYGSRCVPTDLPGVGIKYVCPRGHWNDVINAPCVVQESKTEQVYVQNIVKVDNGYDTTTPFVTMNVRVEDTNAYDGTANLICDVVEGDYFSDFDWSDEEHQVVWSSEASGEGTIYGQGNTISISAPGTYYCTLLGQATGFSVNGYSTKIEVSQTEIHKTKTFVGDTRIHWFDLLTSLYHGNIQVGDQSIQKIYVGNQEVY